MPKSATETFLATPTLAETQSLMCELITAPDGVAARLHTLGVTLPVKPSATMQPEERVAVYAEAYVARIHDSLAEDFPAVRAHLGREAFIALVEQYLQAYPSRSFTLGKVGQHLATFLAEHHHAHAAPWLSSLAAFEWNLHAVFDMEDCNTLSAEDLLALPQEHWPSLQLQAIPALVLQRFHFPVDALYESLTAEGQATNGAAETTRILCWRKAFQPCYRQVHAVESALLSGLHHGTTFAELCTAAIALVGNNDAIPRVTQLLRQWVADQILRQLP